MKLNEDDILEILLEHYQETVFENSDIARGILLGSPGEDLRFIGIFGEEGDSKILQCDLQGLDEEVEFNGDHSFLVSNPEFQQKKSK